MARIARVVAPGLPHHIIQRGNRRQETFFCAEDYQAYMGLLLALVGNWTNFLATGAPEDEVTALPHHERSGRPLGREPFVGAIEGKLGRTLRRGKPGPKRSRAA